MGIKKGTDSGYQSSDLHRPFLMSTKSSNDIQKPVVKSIPVMKGSTGGRGYTRLLTDDSILDRPSPPRIDKARRKKIALTWW